jgi:FkbM family methyltransferase
MIRTQIPTLLMQLDRAYNRYTSFPRGRDAFGHIFRWGTEHCGFHSPVFRLSSGVAFEYSPLVHLDVLTRDLLIRDVFEPDQTMTLRKFLPEGGVFFDVGANLGYFSILGATWVGPKGHVFAFEPYSPIHALLNRNVKLNRVCGIVTSVKLACFSSSGEMAMELGNDTGKTHLSESKNGMVEMVHLITLDEFVKQRAIERIDCIKIDAEGSDFEIIKGARSTIEKFRPVIMLETDNLARFAGSKSDVISLFERLGYFTSEFKCDHSIDLLCMPTEKAAEI